jgi:hypothetical protein
MNKKLSATDYLLTLLFLFMIIGALGAFFYGVKIGQDKTAEKYEKLLVEKRAMSHELTAYHQQYLVSFYHTIYLPYRDFQKNWFSHLESIELRSESVDPEDVFKELGKLAEQKFNSIENMTMPETSPLLVESHEQYLKSLKLFSDASDDFRSKARTLKGDNLINAIQSDAYFKEAKNFALSAQQNYYASIIKWHKSVQPNLAHSELALKEDLNFQEWSQLNLNQKNDYVTRIMASEQYYTSFYPQDLTVRIDEMIANGQTKKMNFTTINPMIEMLVDTKAVRLGDYLKGKQRYYSNETLPQLPFFYE